MSSVASAPGKAILFGEHAVVYGKPAIAVAIDRRVTAEVEGGSNHTRIHIPLLGVEASIDGSGRLMVSSGESGIVKYIKRSLELYHDGSPIDLNVDIDIPIGSGLGSSAAVTVATIAALDDYHGREFELRDTASRAHTVEVDVQGAASPLDTAVSTYGGLIYLDEQREVIPFEADLEDSLVISHTDYSGNTARMVEGVRILNNRFPEIMAHVMDSIENITRRARVALTEDDKESVGELMNINQGLLDSMGVGTLELSMMVYEARAAGAAGSKITGAGGGGSIIAYCPGCIDEVLEALGSKWNSMRADFSEKGVIIL